MKEIIIKNKYKTFEVTFTIMSIENTNNIENIHIQM